MRTKTLKTTAAGLALLTGVVGIASVGATAAFAQDNSSTGKTTTQNEHGRRQELRHRVAKAAVKDAAGAIGISPKELVQDLRAGQTVTQVAQAHNVDPQTVASKLVTDASARIDKAVSENKISQAKGDELKAKLPARVDTLMNRTFGQHKSGN